MAKLSVIRSHFRVVDEKIYLSSLELRVDELPKLCEPDEFFRKLCNGIVSQQLAEKAADAIAARFEKLFVHNIPTPDAVMALPDQALRNVGLSWAKVRYVKDLAQKFEDRSINFSELQKMDDELVVKELTKVKGIGRWTSEMFLIFTLARPDVFSFGDLGLRRAIQNLYGFSKRPTDKQVEKIISKWSPFRSYASLALWKSLDNR